MADDKPGFRSAVLLWAARAALLAVAALAGLRLGASWRALFPAQGKTGGEAGEGPPGAGVPAPLKPPPPPLVSAAARALPEPGAEAA